LAAEPETAAAASGGESSARSSPALARPARRREDGRRWWPAVVAGALDLALFGALLFPWLRAIATSVPAYGDGGDARLIVWVLAQVADALPHALAAGPRALFDVPIFHPSPGQLAGSEHFLGAQVGFAPVWLATGNAVLGANLLVLLSYPLAAFATWWLLCDLGLWTAGAWLAGLVFALGPLRVPAQLNLLQTQAFFLPLTAIALLGLARRPGWQRAGALFAVLAVGLATSYYLATLLCVVVVVWIAVEPAGPPTGRVRRASVALAVLAAAVAALALLSQPYFARKAAIGAARADVASVVEAPPPVPEARSDGARRIRVVFWSGIERTLGGPVCAALAALGIVAVAFRRGRHARRVALAGMALVIVGIGLALGAYRTLLPSDALAAIEFLRSRPRFLALAAFGYALLVGVGADLLRALAGPRAAALVVAVGGLLVVWTRGSELIGPRGLDRVSPSDAELSAYRQIAAIAESSGRGPLLELPWLGSHHRPQQAWAMIGQLEHGLPLVGGYTGYEPAHAPLLRSLVTGLPAPAAVADLVDTTHVRWLLLRPAADWPHAERRVAMAEGLAQDPSLGPRWEIDGWTLQRLDRTPEHGEWFDALARAPEPGRTVLGTSLAALPADSPASIRGPTRGLRVRAGSFVRVPLEIANGGDEPWPVSAAGGADAPGVVYLEVRWDGPRDGDRSSLGRALVQPLGRDVPADEALAAVLRLRAPDEPGGYDLVVRLRQRGGAAFDDAPGAAVRVAVEVGARAADAALRRSADHQRSSS
jgi:hypothetical protein